MILQFEIKPAEKCKKRDVLSALEIYCKFVDPGSMTDTNQIKEYIFNSQAHRQEPRTMFFYLLYGGDGAVEGFSEFAYLPDTQVLVLDYLCTCQRNHVLFYNFYHMVIQEIEDVLKKKGQYIRYIITELSLSQIGGKLIDTDSNYFRHMLSNENFRLLKYPYYQPPLLQHEQAQEFNIAIKLMSVDNSGLLTLDTKQYLAIVNELYRSHYLAWYKHIPGFEPLIQQLQARIDNEIFNNKDSSPIALVQCQLFEEGQCPKFTVENVTLPRIKKRKRKTGFLIFIWILLPILTFILCVVPVFDGIATTLCSVLTIIAGIISIVSCRKDLFDTK